MRIKCRNKILPLDDVCVMGIINVTPDSFSDGGKYKTSNDVLFEVEKMVKCGVDIVDIGAESTRPGFTQISENEEIDRLSDIITDIVNKFDVIVSVDTYKYNVAKYALECGCHIINDVTGLHSSPDIATIVRQYSAGIVLMFNNSVASRNTISTSDIINIAKKYIDESLKIAHNAKIEDDSIIIDPGIGFGTTREQDIALMKNSKSMITQNKYPLLVGCSRKRTIEYLVDRQCHPLERDFGSIAASLACATNGFNIIRIHNVEGMIDAIKCFRPLAN